MSDDILSVVTPFSDVASLAQGYINRVDGERLLVPLEEACSEGEGIRFVVYLADGTAAFAGAGRCAQVSDQGMGVPPPNRYETLIDSLAFDERSQPVYDYMVAVRNAAYGQTIDSEPEGVVEQQAELEPVYEPADLAPVEVEAAEVEVAVAAEIGEAEVSLEASADFGEAEVGEAEVGEAEVGEAEVGEAEVSEAEVGEAEAAFELASSERDYASADELVAEQPAEPAAYSFDEAEAPAEQPASLAAFESIPAPEVEQPYGEELTPADPFAAPIAAAASEPPAYASAPPTYASEPPAYASEPPAYASAPPAYASAAPAYASAAPAYASSTPAPYAPTTFEPPAPTRSVIPDSPERPSFVPEVIPTGMLQRPALAVHWQPAPPRRPTAPPQTGLFRYAGPGLPKPANAPSPALDASRWVRPAARPQT